VPPVRGRRDIEAVLHPVAQVLDVGFQLEDRRQGS
jgi:hypothetical protein